MSARLSASRSCRSRRRSRWSWSRSLALPEASLSERLTVLRQRSHPFEVRFPCFVGIVLCIVQVLLFKGLSGRRVLGATREKTHIKLYTGNYCPYCVRVRRELD